MNKKLSVIIVHWNTPKLLKKCLSLLALKKNLQIIVIDNASNKSPSWINAAFPSVQLIENKINRGYAFACNQGVTNSEGEWLLFLNPDVETTPNQLEALLNHAQKNNLDACSVKTGEPYQKPLPTWWTLFIEFSPINRIKRFLASLGMTKGGIKTLFGGCLMIRKEVLKNLGGWDERFFLWFEDSDLTKRLLDNNYKVGWLNLPIQHSGGESFKNLSDQVKRDIFFNSTDVYAKKYFNFFGQFVISLIKKKYSGRKIMPVLLNGVSITIPNLKQELLQAFLKQSTLSTSYTCEVEWIVVTSSIKPRDVWEWRNKFPQVRFVLIDKNSGFASTVNIGFRVSTGKWLATINDDITINNFWLKDSLSCFKKDTGSVNPVILKSNGNIESMGISIEKKGKALTVPLLYDRTKPVHTKCIEVDATNAAAVVYSHEALNKVGIFDEKFGSYLEDIDLSLRLKRAGYKNIVSLKAKITHLGQSSSKDLKWRKPFLDFKNWLLVIYKNWSWKEILANFPAILLERLRNLSGLMKSLISS